MSSYGEAARLMDDNLRMSGKIVSTDCTVTGHHLHLNDAHMKALREHFAPPPSPNLYFDPRVPVSTANMLLGVTIYVDDTLEPIEHNRPLPWMNDPSLQRALSFTSP